MAEKNDGRPLPPLRGQALWTYEQVKHLDISTHLIFDQMYRNYKRHADGNDSEGENFHHALKIKIIEKEQQLNLLIRKLSEDTSQTPKCTDQLEYEEVENKLQKIKDLLKKRNPEATTEVGTIKDEIQMYLITLDKNIEYYIIQQKLNEEEKETDPQANSSISDLDLEITPTVKPTFTYRRSERHKDMNATSRKLKTQTNKKQEKEVEKLNKECEELQSRLIKADEEIEQLKDSLKTVERQMEKLEQENEELQQELKNSREAQEIVQQSFEELNLELAKLRNDKASNQHTSTEYVEEEEYIDNEISLSPLSQDSNNTDEEVSTNDTALSRQNIKDIFENLKNLNKQVSLEKDTNSQYQRGYQMLKNDFLRYGRKTWNTKTVETYLRLLTNKKDNMTKASNEQNCSEQGLDILSDLFRMIQALKVSGRIIEKFHENLKHEIETLKNSKSKFIPIQTAHDEFETLITAEMQEVINLAKELSDKFKNYITVNPTNIMQQINEKLNDAFNKLIIHPTKGANQTKNIDQQKENNITQSREDHQKIKKLIIIPKETSKTEEITKQIREEIMKPEIRNKIKSIKKTLNNNIEIRSLDSDLQQIKTSLETEQIHKNAEIIEPTLKTLKLLLLRVPKDISKEDLQAELSQNYHFQDTAVEVLKNISVKEKWNNWIIKTAVRNGRPVLQRGKIKVLTENIRVVRYIGLLRCSNCQAIEDHLTADCKYTTECASCAQKHHTNNCTNQIESCINCIRDGKRDTAHKASSNHCPYYQEIKKLKLESYYGRSIKDYHNDESESRERLPRTDQSTDRRIKDSNKQRGYDYRNKSTNRSERPGYQRENREYPQNRRNDYSRKTRQNLDRNEETTRIHRNEIIDRNGDKRTITMRVFENSNRIHNQYPKQIREAGPPHRR